MTHTKTIYVVGTGTGYVTATGNITSGVPTYTSGAYSARKWKSNAVPITLLLTFIISVIFSI